MEMRERSRVLPLVIYVSGLVLMFLGERVFSTAGSVTRLEKGTLALVCGRRCGASRDDRWAAVDGPRWSAWQKTQQRG